MPNPAPGFERKPDHTITVTPHDGTVRVCRNGEVLAQSSRALILREASYPPVYYMPLDDVIAPATPTQTSTYCPFKGDASLDHHHQNGAVERRHVGLYEPL